MVRSKALCFLLFSILAAEGHAFGAFAPLQRSKATNVPPVHLEVFYETLCPDSKAFIVDQLYPALGQINDIVNVSLVPYGKATEKKVGDGWEFKCQHGPRECMGNVIQTCALHHLPPAAIIDKKGIAMAYSLINCMENARDPSTAGPNCATTLGINFAPIDACSKNSQGNQLEHEMAARTNALNPKLYWVPWINVNGVHNNGDQSRALYDLLGLICSKYQGTKPAACSQ